MKGNTRFKLLIISAGATAGFIVWIGWQFLPVPPAPVLPTAYHADKAVWLGISWVMERHRENEIQALAQNLQRHEVTYVFAYVSYLKAGDFFNPTFDYATDFVRVMHKAAPGIQILAWIGVPVQLTTSEGEVIPNRLENGAIRATIAEFARQMVEEIGFDGIHLNAEFITAGNQAFIDTLQVIREVLPDKAILSTTAHALPPTTRITIAPIGLDRENQSTQYLQQIARNSDQVALMAYDSGLFFPSDYRAWVTHQVKTASEEIEGIDTQFLIGLPTSEEFTASHRTNTENLSNAIYGLQQGLADNPFYANIDGIAIYPYWETDEHEWTLIDSIN